MAKKRKATKTRPAESARVKFYRTFGLNISKVGDTQAIAECPWCSKEKLYINIESGQYHCKTCDEKGNCYTYLRSHYDEAVEGTTDKHFQALKAKRGISVQTLKRHGLAYDIQTAHWLIPFKNEKGSVVNLQRYNLKSGKKYNLPGLSLSLYGAHQLPSSDPSKIVYLCEGPFDAVALDYQLKNKRGNYDIVACPGPFQKAWAELFRDRKVIALFDNDAGGDSHRQTVIKLLGNSRIAADLRVLGWPKDFSTKGYDINDLVKDYPEIKVAEFIRDNCVQVPRGSKLVWTHGNDVCESQASIDWIWPDRIRCGTYVSFSGNTRHAQEYRHARHRCTSPLLEKKCLTVERLESILVT